MRTLWLLGLSFLATCSTSDSHAMVVYVPGTSWIADTWQHYFYLPYSPTGMPSHATGIPDDVVRRVELRAASGGSGSDSSSSTSCRSFDIEQVIGGADTGSVLWSGSVLLAEHIRSQGIAAGSTVIELGTGLGLVSIVASCLGASVVASDGDAAILPLVQRNILRNLDSSHGAIDVRQLWWGDQGAARALGSFDLILGADLVYGSDSVVGPAAREASFAKLLCTMWLLSNDETTLVLAYRERKVVERLFFSKLWERFEPAVVREEVAQLAGSSGVQVYTFRRRRGVLRPGAEGVEQAPSPLPYCVDGM